MATHRLARATRGRRTRASARPIAALAAALCLAACGAPRARDIPDEAERSSSVPATAWSVFLEARAKLLAGDAAGARGLLQPLLADHPDSVAIGRWWQEAEAAAGDEAFLLEHSRELAEAAPSAATCVLAARAEKDPASASAWLDRGERLDPDNPWVHHARAVLAARAGEHVAARRALARALAADPGHRQSLRLEAWFLARDGELEKARALLAGWLGRAADDPRLLPALVEEARLDLALLELQTGEPAEAEDLLAAVDRAHVAPWRFRAARAAVRQATGDTLGALEDARAAREAAPQELLPWVQEALLQEEHLGAPELALPAWQAARALAGARDDLPSTFETLRARVHIERLTGAAAKAAAEQP